MKSETKKMIRLAGIILFTGYILLLIYFLFFAEWYGRGFGIREEMQYNLYPFKEILRFWNYREKLGFRAVFLNLAGNVIGFIPFGFILPIINKRHPKFFQVTILGFFLSFTVECIQLVIRVGIFDVDDMMLNTLGAAVGYLIFYICNTLRRKIYGKTI